MPEQTDAPIDAVLNDAVPNDAVLNDAVPNDAVPIGAARSDEAPHQSSEDSSALVSRLRVIEDQPLDQRAAAFTQIHDRLQSTLEGGDSSHQHG
jgi:hypothetical protein